MNFFKNKLDLFLLKKYELISRELWPVDEVKKTNKQTNKRTAALS